MNSQEANFKKYCKRISRELVCPKDAKKRILADIKRNIEDYLEENPDADYEKIQAHFGTPRQITETYIEELGTPDLIRKLKTKNKIMKIICIAVGVCVLLWVTALAIALIDAHHSSNRHYEVYITED